MSLTPAQREAAIERMAEADYLSGRRASLRPWSGLTAAHRSDYRRTAAAALDALSEEFVVLSKSELREVVDSTGRYRQRVTRWESISNPTKEQ